VALLDYRRRPPADAGRKNPRRRAREAGWKAGRQRGARAPVAGLVALWLAAGFVSSPAGAAGEVPSVETSVSTRVVAVGDTFRLNLKLAWSAGTDVKPLAVPDKMGDFVVKDVLEGPASVAGGGASREISVVLAAFEPGPKTVPPVRLVYLAGDGSSGEIETRPVEVEVKSVLPEDAGGIRDIKKPLSAPRKWKDLIRSYALVVGLAVAAATSILVSFKRREEIQGWLAAAWRRVSEPLLRLLMALLALVGLVHKRGTAAFDVRVDEPGLAPGEAALREIARIEALGLLGRGMMKELYTLVSETMRRFVERSYGVLAMESPTSYTIRALADAGLPDRPRGLVDEVLSEADLVKFAKHDPGERAVATLLERARTIVALAGPGRAGDAGPETSDEGSVVGGGQR
jgi:hypothetical protein